MSAKYDVFELLPNSSFLLPLLAVRQDSYLNPYFSDMKKYLHVGPPVYFVITEGYNYSDVDNQNKVEKVVDDRTRKGGGGGQFCAWNSTVLCPVT